MAEKLSKRVENTVGKGEIVCYEQFLLFPWCFQKACFPGASKGVIVWEWVKYSLILSQTIFHKYSLILSQMTNVGLYQIERVSRQQMMKIVES